jgi:hypothetical protein
VRVQRAPYAADQPAPRPDGSHASSGAAGFSAHVDLDLTRLRSDYHGEVIGRLVTACRDEQLIDDRSALQLVRLTGHGLVGARLAGAVNQSAYAIGAALTSATAGLPASSPRTLTVVVNESRVQATGDWGWGGTVLATLGPAVPTLAAAPDHGLGIMQRSVARLGLAAPNGSTAVVRALDAVARSLGS